MYNLDELMQARGLALYHKAKGLIPGGSQLLSKRPEMFAPDIWPPYYSKAKACRVWDLDDREFIDMSIMSVGACILGYADDDIDDAVVSSLRNGVASSLNCPEDIELAELLIELHPWFGMVRYARSGGEAMGIAVRIARAYTKRDVVLFSGYHGWNDWYLAANLADKKNLDGQLMSGLSPIGVPRGLVGTAIPFEPNNIESLRSKVRGNELRIAAIVIEPARGEDAPLDYLKHLREFAKEIGAVLIFDEITSGFRMCAGGIHRNYGVHPDIAVFAKSIANGYPISVVMGTETVMQASQSTFISSTNWTDRIGPSAALATIRKYQKFKVASHIINKGTEMKNIWIQSARSCGLKIQVSGLPSLPSFSFSSENSLKWDTRFTIEMLKNGYLSFRQFKPSYAHNDIDMAAYKNCVNKVFTIIRQDPESNGLNTPSHHVGFQRITRE